MLVPARRHTISNVAKKREIPRLTFVEIERIDVSSSDISSHVDDLEGCEVGVKDEGSRILEDNFRERDTVERGKDQFQSLVQKAIYLPKEVSSSAGCEGISRSSTNDDRHCETRRLSYIIEIETRKTKDEPLGISASPPRPLIPLKVVAMFSKGIVEIGMLPAFVLATTEGKRKRQKTATRRDQTKDNSPLALPESEKSTSF